MTRTTNGTVLHHPRFTAEERLLFACTTPRMTDEQARRIVAALGGAACDWELVFKVAIEHGVCPLVYRHLRRLAGAGLDVPRPILMRLKLAQFEKIEEKERARRMLRDVLAFFNSHDMPVMLVKGAALDAVVHEEPWHTTSLDIDVLIRPRAEEIPDDLREQVWHFNRTGPFECDFHEHHDLNIDGVLPVDFEAIWRAARRIEYLGHAVYVMSPVDMLIAACTSSCRKRYFTLKSLYGIREIVRRLGPFDPPTIVERAATHDCQAIVYTALSAARLTVGCPIDDAVLQQLAVRVGRRQLIDFLAARLSFSPLARRVGFRSGGGAAASVINRAKWDSSLLLPFASYRSYQVLRRVGWLARNRGKNQ
ncbi:MAG: nucleotidyltransferase family protein [Phycisphaeraceae bacterium]